MKFKSKGELEKLNCNCEDGGKHEEYVDGNGERVVKCEVCKRFLKFPAK